MSNPNRVSAGVPTGGQFTAPDRAESDVNLAQPSEDDLGFARETLGPNATEDEVRHLAEQRLDRDEPEQTEPVDDGGHRCWYCSSPGPHDPNHPAEDPHVYKSTFEALSQINSDQPDPTPDQSYCDVGRHQQCSGYTEDESDPETCMCNCHDEHLR